LALAKRSLNLIGITYIQLRMTCVGTVMRALLSVAATLAIAHALEEGAASCKSELPTGRCLIQRDLGRIDAVGVVNRHELVQGTPKNEDKAAKTETHEDDDALPSELRELGLKLFGTEENLKKVVSNSTLVKATVFDIELKLRIKKGDNAVERLPDEGKTDEYGVNKIMDEGPSVHGMINVVDMGANYGIVPIALFHKYPKHVRAVIAELVPTTYFFLRWNLHLNEVPLLTEEELQMKGKDRTPGVLAVNKGVSEKDEADMHVCWSPDNSMNAMICDCKKKPFPSECLTVKTISTPSMLKFFGKDGIDFLKMDCEGCELHSLPALAKMDDAPKLIRRLVGELHEVPPEIEDIACKFNHKTWMTKVCRNRGAGQQLECNPKTRDEKCYVPVPWPRP